MAVKKRAATKTRKAKRRGPPTAATLKRRAARAALKNRVKNAVNKVVRSRPKPSASKVAAKKRANAARSKALKQAYATAQTKKKSIKVVKKNGATARSRLVKKPPAMPTASQIRIRKRNIDKYMASQKKVAKWAKAGRKATKSRKK